MAFPVDGIGVLSAFRVDRHRPFGVQGMSTQVLIIWATMAFFLPIDVELPVAKLRGRDAFAA